ncbi:hypothetical protein ACFQPG_10460 [Sphingomonas sp. GCM10030256]|uniref:hypothetical protein n=1 Tax=Sphingomonas sp. GCM10030256 TaxID=3273427 RepID=UPI003617A1AC
MHNSTSIVALGALLVSGPALAQVNLGAAGVAHVNANVGAGANAGGIVKGVTGTLDRTVNVADRSANRALTSNLRLATRTDIRAGTEVRDSRGRRIGTVQSVHGSMAIVVQGNRGFHVPISKLYRGTKGLVTSLTFTQLNSTATANASANAHAHH